MAGDGRGHAEGFRAAGPAAPGGASGRPLVLFDREADAPCQQASRILKTLGARLAWEYLTTPIGLHASEAAPWQNLAQSLSQEGELDLADLAYAAAFDAEPTNAQLLWDRAQNLRQAGKLAEERAVLRRIADGQWQPRFNWIQSQARWQSKGR